MVRKTFRRTVIFFFLILLISFLPSCQKKQSEPARKEVTLVEIAPVQQGDIFKEIRFTGSIEASTEVKVFPKITAKIETMNVDSGDSVKKGDLIALLEPEDLRAQVAQAEAALQSMRAKWKQMEVGARSEELAQAEDLVAKARANLKDADNNYERLKGLFNRGVIAKREFDSAELAYTVGKADLNSAQKRLDMLIEGATKEDRQALQAQVHQAEAALDLAKIHLSYTRITSPIGGTISQRFFDPGNLAVPTQPLVAIVRMDSVKVIVYFSEHQIRFMVPGADARLLIATYADQVFHGTIDKVSPTLDPTTRMFSAEIKVMNEKRLLRPGMFTAVVLSVDPHLNALWVPKEAVLYTEEYQENTDSGQEGVCQVNYLFVVKDGRAHKRKVSLGHESGHVVEVCEGVGKGEHVVVRGLHQLNDGDQITVVKREEVEKVSLASLSIKRAITFAMIYIFVFGFGLFGLSRLKIDLYPDVSFPVIAVITTYTGVAPEEMETLVTKPIEEAVASVENIKHIRSLSKLGASLVLAEFDWGLDLDKSEKDIRNNIDYIREFLPEEADEPIIIQFDPQKMPILFMSVSGPMGPAELRELCRRRIKPALERIEDVASAETAGGLKRQIQVQIDPAKLHAQSLSVDAVISALRRENLQVPGGKLDEGETEFSVRTLSEYTSVEQIGDTVIGYRNGTPIYIGNVAQVSDGYEEITRVVRNNQKPGVLLIVSKTSKANTVQVTDRVIKELPNILQKLPAGVKAGVIFNQADFIKRSISNLSSTAVQAFLLTLLVLLFFLHNIRASVIVALSIPMSVIVTFSVLDLAHLTLNIMSMAGLALAIGMLVDNSIVVLENIYRHTGEGGQSLDSAEHGTNEVSIAIIASTLTTIAVFFPVLFVPGIAGVLFNDMALTICFSLFISLLVSLTLIPLLSSRFLKIHREPKRSFTSGISDWIDLQLQKMYRGYSQVLNGCLNHRKTTLIIAIVLFGGSLALIPVIGFDFFPKMDEGQFEIQVERAPGTGLKSTEMTFREIEEIIHDTIAELKNQNSDIGVGETFSAFAKGSYAGVIRVNLIDREKRKRKQMEIESALRKKIEQIAGITFSISHSRFLGEEGDLIIYLYGEDINTARILSEKIKNAIKDIPGAVDVNTSLEAGRPELQLILDRDRISALGLSAAQVTNAVSTYIKGTRASLFRDRGEEYEILVRLDRKYRENTEILKDLFVTSPRGDQIPLSSIARTYRSLSPASILRRDQQRVTNISVTVQGQNLEEVTRQAEAQLKKMDIPSDFTYEIGGSAQDMRTSFKWLGLAFGGAAFIVYMVMASLYESFMAPFIIFLTIPLCVVGVIVILLLTGTPLSVVAFIGIIMLAGIVVNNSIVLVDYTNQLRAKGYGVREAVMEAGRTRLRPILMTSLTTIFGLAPLALGLGSGGESWAPMARTVIGGLTTSTLVTLLVIPVIYTYLAPKKIVQ